MGSGKKLLKNLLKDFENMSLNEFEALIERTKERRKTNMKKQKYHKLMECCNLLVAEKFKHRKIWTDNDEQKLNRLRKKIEKYNEDKIAKALNILSEPCMEEMLLSWIKLAKIAEYQYGKAGAQAIKHAEELLQFVSTGSDPYQPKEKS